MGIFRKTKKQKQKEKENLEEISTNTIKIRIFRSVGSDLVTKVAEFTAQEVLDENNSLIVINEDYKFKEDFGFQKDRVYESMELQLKLKNKDKRTRYELITKAIQEQEKLIEDLETNSDKNKDYNYQDEVLKLRQLRVLRDSVKKETNGSYMRLEKNGVKCYEFLSIDGILKPYFFGSTDLRVYPDLQTKKKLFNSENTIFQNEHNIGGYINWVSIILIGIAVLFVFGNAFWSFQLYSKSSEIGMEINQGALICSNSLAEIHRTYGVVLQDFINIRREERENNININDNNINSGIVLDPNIIGR